MNRFSPSFEKHALKHLTLSIHSLSVLKDKFQQDKQGKLQLVSGHDEREKIRHIVLQSVKRLQVVHLREGNLHSGPAFSKDVERH